MTSLWGRCLAFGKLSYGLVQLNVRLEILAVLSLKVIGLIYLLVLLLRSAVPWG